MEDLNAKRVTVLGLGRFGGGIGVSRWLCQQGAQVTVVDEAPEQDLAESKAQLADLPVTFHFGGMPDDLLDRTDLLVISPAVPPRHPLLAQAQHRGVPVTLEIRLFIERCPATILGVTGTKGKSTTAALLARMLQQKYRTFLGGNVGGSLLPKLSNMCSADMVVLELSSFMLEHLRPMRWSPHVAVITMLSQDHADWHGSIEAYLDAKRNLVRFQTREDFAVLGPPTPVLQSFEAVTAARIVRYGLDDSPQFLLRLPGRHNQLNAQAAFAAAQCMDVTREQAQLGIAGFTGLPHRMQIVHESDGVTWVNDSIATIPEAAIAANQAFPQGKVIQIVGGYDKKLDWTEMCRQLTRGCKAVLTIGAIGPRLAELRRRHGAQVWECGNLANAVATARALAREGDVVLLSTGTASYDQFKNFEQRGDAFTELARSQ
ncbi:MAG: UDP-N-acetylmuramoyl-L-alanine--D-glutamate ligase [Phycisphaerales bacterium]|nr:UDP-N-acetylmuramoyl-L-alanine--D-glutamate ligase [Phycisphaerales bacterium]